MDQRRERDNGFERELPGDDRPAARQLPRAGRRRKGLRDRAVEDADGGLAVRRLAVAGAVAVFLALPVAAQAFTPDDPLLPRQWYASQDHAFDAFSVLPALASVRVAVIDTGIDLSHPELAGRIAATRSFVGGSVVDTQGHGTFVAGEIAAAIDNSRGIAGLAPPARLLIAKVVDENGQVAPRAEARAIRWSVRRGARSTPRRVTACSSSRRSATAPGRRSSRGRTRATRRRCRTSSGSARTAATETSRCSRTATRSTST